MSARRRRWYFRDKVVLLTGANGGLGAELARKLAEGGARVILSDVARPARGADPRALAFIPADLRRKDAPRRLAARALGVAGELDVLINNAGIATIGDFADTPDERWQEVLEVNLLAPMRLARCVIPHMVARRSGHIVNVSSIGGHVALPRTAPYVASKWGLRGFGAALHAELAEHRVRVTNVYPSFTRTPILASERFGFTSARTELPGALLDEPAAVVAAALDGVARGELHVFPSLRSRALGELTRVAPGAAAALTRHFWTIFG